MSAVGALIRLHNRLAIPVECFDFKVRIHYYAVRGGDLEQSAIKRPETVSFAYSFSNRYPQSSIAAMVVSTVYWTAVLAGFIPSAKEIKSARMYFDN